MRIRLLLASIAALLLGVVLLAWWRLPQWWPDGVVAYSPFLEPAIRAEARRQSNSPPVFTRHTPYVSLMERIGHDPAAGKRSLIRALTTDDAAVRRIAAEHLAYLHLRAPGDAAGLTVVADHINDGDAQVRAALIFILGEALCRQDLLLFALGDSSPRVRRQAVSGLDGWHSATLLPAFIAMLADPNDTVACAAMDALGSLADARAVPPLLTALEANRHGAVHSAGAALLKCPLRDEERSRTLALLVRALRSDGVRWSALSAKDLLIGSLGEEAIPFLRQALDDPDYQSRQFAASLLRNQGEPPSPRLITVSIEGLRDDAYPYGRDGVTYLCNAKEGTCWLWIHQPVGTAELRTALASDDAQQRFLAAWLLAMRGDTESTAPICAELVPHLRDGSKPAPAWAIRALFLLGPTARPHLEAALPTANARQAACIQLLVRDWVDPPASTAEAARRGTLRLSWRYHDPAWEPSLEAPGLLPEPFPDVSETR